MSYKIAFLSLLFTSIFAPHLSTAYSIITKSIQTDQRGCTVDQVFTKQKGCIYSCEGSFFIDCPHVPSAAKVCALKTDNSWVSFSDQCEPCLDVEVRGVSLSPCQTILPPILFAQKSADNSNISYCVKNENCKVTQICDSRTNLCLDKCASSHCTFGCVNGTCLTQTIPVCNSDADCRTQQNCQGNRCVNLCFNSVCFSNSKCYKGQCYPLGYCLNNSECKINETCYLGKCSAIRQACGNSSCNPGQKCFNKKCYTNLNQTKCIGNKCKLAELCSYGICINKCLFAKCPLGMQCINGECIATLLKCNQNLDCDIAEICKNQFCEDICKTVKCRVGEICYHGVCIFYPVKCKDDNGCGCGQRCFSGICVDKCNNANCTAGQTCANGTCFDSNCDNKACPNDSYCKNGQCVPNILPCADPQLKFTTFSCTNPRPNDKTCPPDNSTRQPDPLYCGIRQDGTRINFARDCQACKDNSIMYYFDKPCSEAPFICEKTDKCLDYYCSSNACLNDESCPYDWQMCTNGRCVDKCSAMKCLGCRFGQCDYDTIAKRNCTVNSDCGAANWLCDTFKCVGSCVHISCLPNQVCKNGACAPA